MNRSIFFVGGSKGGVGKSLVSVALIDFLLGQGLRPHLIETDESNPDVAKAHAGAGIEITPLSLDTDGGWEDFLSIAMESNNPIVVNSAARNGNGFNSFGPLLNSVEDIVKRFVPIWVINTQKDSLELFKEFQSVIPNCSAFYVVKNGQFGKEEDFVLYDKSKLKSGVKETLYMPKLLKTAADAIYIDRQSICGILDAPGLKFGTRIFVEQWRNIFADEIRKVVGGV